MFILKDATLVNELPKIIPAIEAVEYSPAVPATETEPEIPEVPAVAAVPKKYIFRAFVFSSPDNAPEGKFIQSDEISFETESTEDAVVSAKLLVEAQKLIDKYNEN